MKVIMKNFTLKVIPKFCSVNGQTITLEKTLYTIYYHYASIDNKKLLRQVLSLHQALESTVEINPSNYKNSDTDTKVKLVAYGKGVHFSDQSYLLMELLARSIKNWAVYKNLMKIYDS